MARERKTFGATEVRSSSLLKLWNDHLNNKNVTKSGQVTEHFKKYSAFCDKIASKLFDIDEGIRVYFTSKYILFEKEDHQFLGIEPQKNKLSFAPITLKPSDIQDMAVSYKDITGKIYSMGGNIRVYFEKCDDTDLSKANKIAEMSFNASSENMGKGYFAKK
ncbi:hypothetical protein HQ584_07990 [Patescibacteria group bacterium]|nr:hypothetical protein [Patescibacteria group bacterium]